MPAENSDRSLADQFADHFMSKISKIRQSLDGYQNFSPKIKCVPKFEEF